LLYACWLTASPGSAVAVTDGGLPPQVAPASPAAGTGAAPVQRYKLKRQPGRGWLLEDPRFLARIAEDGTVSFSDRHGAIGLVLPFPAPLPAGTPTLQGALRDLTTRNKRRQAAVDPSGYNPSPQWKQGFEVCEYPRHCFFESAVTLIAVAGTFDVTDEILRLGKGRPYRALEARFLASTADFRRELRDRALARSRARALAALGARLDAIARERRPLTERHALMRALAEDLDPDPAVAGAARALIDGRVAALAR